MQNLNTKFCKNDQVIVLSGRDRGKVGRILRIDRIRNRVLVENVNMVKKTHRRKSQNDQGGIIEIEAPIHISNVGAVAKDGRPSRIGYRMDGKRKARILKRTGEVFDAS